jgi:hypothetical protein
MNEELAISKLIPIIAPFLVIQLILMVIAITLCIKAEATRGPKPMWILIIIFVNIVGLVAFLIAGRKNER